MRVLRGVLLTGLVITLICIPQATRAQQQQQQQPPQRARSSAMNDRGRTLIADSHLTGVYRIDIAESDKLYSVIEGATSNLPYREQQRFFLDLAVRLTPPDLLAIAKQGSNITIASSRAPRFTFEADGVTRTEKDSNGMIVDTRATLNADQLSVNSSGRTHDKFTVTFIPFDNGNRLRVIRRIYAAELNQPVIIQSIYNRISQVAQWSVYGEPPQTASTTVSAPNTMGANSVPAPIGRDEAETLRNSLNQWVAATNTRDINKLTAFYMPTLRAYYLQRNVTRSFVRNDKLSAFRRAASIEVQAAEPEIFFSHASRTAIMRYRKKYLIDGAARRRSGEVVQELRWQKEGGVWKITSERDVRVIR